MRSFKFKRWISALIATFLLLGSVNVVIGADTEVDWSDVERYYPFSSWAVDTGIKYKLIFLENNRRETTRYEVANILFNLSSLKNDVNKEFSDIDEINPALKERILKVAGAGIVQGYDDGTFRPNNKVTRAEFVTMLNKSNLLKDVKANNQNVKFIDIGGHWAEKNIIDIAKIGIVTGKGDDKFCPEENITPQELLIILDRLVSLKCISEEKLVTTITDTFQSKRYGEKEQYIIEVMYSQFDKVQNDIIHVWPYNNYYNVENWQEKVTYNDLLYAIYFATTKKANIDDILPNGESRIDRMTRYMFEVQGLENNKEAYINNSINMRNLLYFISASCQFETRGAQSLNNIPHKAKSPGGLEFSNINELSPTDMGTLISASLFYVDNIPYYENNKMYFPMGAPVTKYMLNYTILRLQKRYNIFDNMVGSRLKDMFGENANGFETDPGKLPYNYYQYPFVVKGVPKEVYEKQFKIGDEGMYTPLQCYGQFYEYEDYTRYTARKYYDTILNVDYRTLNIDSFVKEVMNYSISSEREVRAYAEYVINNQIILKGKGELIPGTIYLSSPFTHMRAVIKFDVISALDKTNLLYKDLNYCSQEGQLLNVEYTKDNYELAYDVILSGVYDIQEWKIAGYKIYTEPVIESYYYNGCGITQMP